MSMHLHQHPVAVKWGGSTSLELSSPSPPPFTPGKKEYGLHFAADASPGDETRGITGGVGMLATSKAISSTETAPLLRSALAAPATSAVTKVASLG